MKNLYVFMVLAVFVFNGCVKKVTLDNPREFVSVNSQKILLDNDVIIERPVSVLIKGLLDNSSCPVALTYNLIPNSEFKLGALNSKALTILKKNKANLKFKKNGGFVDVCLSKKSISNEYEISFLGFKFSFSANKLEGLNTALQNIVLYKTPDKSDDVKALDSSVISIPKDYKEVKVSDFSVWDNASNNVPVEELDTANNDLEDIIQEIFPDEKYPIEEEEESYFDDNFVLEEQPNPFDSIIVREKEVVKGNAANVVIREKKRPLIKAMPDKVIDKDAIGDKNVTALNKKVDSNITTEKSIVAVHIPKKNIVTVYSFEDSRGDTRHTINKSKFLASVDGEWKYKGKSPFKALKKDAEGAVPVYECRTLFDTYFYSIKKSYIKGFCKKGEKPKRVFYVLKRFIRGAVPVIQMYNSKSNFAAYIVTEKQKKLLQKKGFEVSMSEAWGSPK